MKRPILFLIVCFIFLIACQQETAVEPTNTSLPEVTIEDTAVPPTDTPKPEPTDTVVPPPTEAVVNEETASPDEPTEEPTPETAAEPTEEPKVAPERFTEELIFTADDGVIIHATFYGTRHIAPQAGIILLHMNGGRRNVWADIGFVDLLAENEYAILSIDMRGHGETGGSKDWTATETDLLQIWTEFTTREDVDAERTAVVGASIGSNMSLITGDNIPTIDTVVLLSPGLDYFGITTDDRIVSYGDRPIFIIASEEDRYAAESSETLAELATGIAELQMYNGAGHGTNMFGPEPQLAKLILDWLNTHIRN